MRGGHMKADGKDKAFMEVGIKIEGSMKEMAFRIFPEYLKKYPAIRRILLADHEGS